MIITIDGPTGTGKSTIAKLLAERLGYIHVDTGAMYRCVTYGVLKHHIVPENPKDLADFLKGFDFSIKVVSGEKRYIYEGEDITDAIRTEEVTSLVSRVSAQSIVREKLVDIQRQLGKDSNSVFEGRDLGTVVFPKAELKIYLTAKPEICAKRRYEELKTKFPEKANQLSYEEVLEKVLKRDAYDSGRDLSPLKKAEDAHEVDTSDLSIDQVLDRIIEIKDSLNQ